MKSKLEYILQKATLIERKRIQNEMAMFQRISENASYSVIERSSARSRYELLRDEYQRKYSGEK